MAKQHFDDMNKIEIKQIEVGFLQANCYLLVSEGKVLIIDPGAEAEKILKEIQKTNAKVRYIINTHYHLDHTSANERIRKQIKAKGLEDLEGMEILIHKNDKKFLSFQQDGCLENGDEIKIGDCRLIVIHTPGHSQGSICLRGENFIFTGDTLFKGGYGRTDLPGGSQEELEKSLEKLQKIIKPGTMVYPGHGESFKI